jgi:hypothetical protein
MRAAREEPRAARFCFQSPNATVLTRRYRCDSHPQRKHVTFEER